MTPNPFKSKRRITSETGAIQRVDGEPTSLPEPPAPPNLPEFDEHGAITGRMRLRPEGDDSAKQDDDTGKNTSVDPPAR